MNNNSDSDNDGTWSDDEEMTSSFQCICNPTMTFQTLSAAIEYDAEHYQFNMLDYIAAMCTCTDTDNYDFYSGSRELREQLESAEKAAVRGSVEHAIEHMPRAGCP